MKIKILAVVFVLLSGSAAAQDLRGAAAKEIAALMDRQQSAWNRGDIDGYMNEYWNSDSLLFTSGGKIQKGWAATRDKYRKSYDSNEKMGRLRFSEVEIKLLSESSAWIFGRWELRRKADAPGGVFTLILKKFGSEWKIIHDHTSSQNDK